MKKQILEGVVHKVPADLKKALTSNNKTLEIWNNLPPLARNEFICQVESTKKAETRENRINRICEDLMNGKRRPCCWTGCPHRKDKL